MAIGIRSETSGTGTGTGSLSISKPSSVANGDYLVVIIGVGDDLRAVTVPDGTWTRADQSGDGTGNGRQIAICNKYITDAAGEPSSYSFGVGSGDNAAWWIGSLYGISSTNPEDEAVSGNSLLRQNDQSPITSTITTVTKECFVLAGFAVNYSAISTAPGGSWSQRVKDLALTYIALSVYSQTQASYGNIDCEITGLPDAAQETQCGIWAFRPMIQSVSSAGNAVHAQNTASVALSQNQFPGVPG